MKMNTLIIFKNNNKKKLIGKKHCILATGCRNKLSDWLDISISKWVAWVMFHSAGAAISVLFCEDCGWEGSVAKERRASQL